MGMSNILIDSGITLTHSGRGLDLGVADLLLWGRVVEEKENNGLERADDNLLVASWKAGSQLTVGQRVFPHEFPPGVLRLVMAVKIVDRFQDGRGYVDGHVGVRRPCGGRKNIDAKLHRRLLLAFLKNALVGGHLIPCEINISKHLLEVVSKASTAFWTPYHYYFLQSSVADYLPVFNRASILFSASALALLAINSRRARSFL